MIGLSPKTMHLLVSLNSGASDVRSLKDIEKSILEQYKEYITSPPPIRVRMFDLLNKGENEPNGRSMFLSLMNNPKIDIIDVEYNLRQLGEGDNIRWHYTSVVTYREMPFYGPHTNYELFTFTLPDDQEKLGDFLSKLSSDNLVIQNEKPYIKRTSIIRQDRIFELTGSITYYYHTISRFSPVGGSNEITGIPKAYN